MPRSRAPGWRGLAGRRTAPLLLVFLAPAAACQAWRAEPLRATGAPAEHARLTRLDGRVDELLDARVERDTVRGDRLGHRGREDAVAVPLDSVRRFEVRRVSGPRTLGLAAGVAAAYLGFAYWFSDK